MPLLSLIIPVYNTEQYLERCLDSVLSQSLAEIEVIIVNDCSPGNVAEIAQRYQQIFKNFKYIEHTNNKGLFQARLTGYSHSTGDYIAFLDSDDYVTRDYYRSLAEKANNEYSDIVIGRTVLEKQDGSHLVYNFHDICLSFDQLEGDDILRKFWEQEGLCYSWHTIWNKIYSRQIWEQAYPYFQKIKTHLIMTEDIAFSSVLFYFAKKVSTVKYDGYYYCENKNASTDSDNIPFLKYKKNLEDITVVFNFLKEFLEEQRVSSCIMDHYDTFRKYYAKMWKSHALATYSGKEKTAALSLVEILYPNLRESIEYKDHFFNTVLTPWNGGLEYAKDLIASSEFEWISFDIFDTLICRPVYNPTDIFFLMDTYFYKIMHTSVPFSKLRIQGEQAARDLWGRKTPLRQDITLSQIYDTISEIYHISPEICGKLKEYECELELQLSECRNAGKELYHYAQAIGKKIILTSDMYLEKRTIESLLSKNGYANYQHLFLSSETGYTKNTGSLFKHVINYLNIQGNHLLHIGDTWNGDIEQPQKYGIHTFFLPKAKDAMDGKIQGIQTNSCGNIGDFACSDIVNRKKYKQSIGYNALFALVANKYFDNPYRYFNPETDFNLDPYFIGYYPVGMHLIGFSKWLIEESLKYGYKKLYFMSRDGYLPMQVYKQIAKLYSNAPEAEYLYSSRKAVMPFILNHTYDFYDMPIEASNHSPKTLLALLFFCTKDISEEELFLQLRKHNITYDSCFKGNNEYLAFITFFLSELYDADKHKNAKKLCSSYYQKIMSDAATVDMGYSGRIQGAISAAVGHGVDVFFIHADNKQYQVESQKYGFNIHSFYDFTPCMTGLIREHLFSSSEPSCVGFYDSGTEITPVFDKEDKTYTDKFVVNKVHQGAIELASDFVSKFGVFYFSLPIKPVEISFPYEGFLRYMKSTDLQVFSASFFEDTVYGAKEGIKISSFLAQQYTEFNLFNRLNGSTHNAQLTYSDALAEHVRDHNSLIKFFVYLFADRETLRTKLWFKLQNKTLLFRICRKVYRCFFR